MRSTPEALAQQAQQLRIELLERLLETTETFLQLTEMEVSVENRPHSAEGLEHIQQGLRTIRKIMADVSSPSVQAGVSKRLDQLEQRAAKLTKEFEDQKH